MEEKKWYYKLENGNEDETLYCAVDLPVKPENLPDLVGLEGLNYTAAQISKEEYEENADL